VNVTRCRRSAEDKAILTDGASILIFTGFVQREDVDRPSTPSDWDEIKPGSVVLMRDQLDEG
jgi:hypothetical protein